MEYGVETPDLVLNAFIDQRIQEVSGGLTGMTDPEMEASVVNRLLWAELGLSVGEPI